MVCVCGLVNVLWGTHKPAISLLVFKETFCRANRLSRKTKPSEAELMFSLKC
jgi:hypothetical protein